MDKSTDRTAQRKKIILLTLFLFILSLAFRLFIISKGPYHPDCLFLAIQSQKILETGKIQYLQGTGLPLTAIMGAAFIFLSKIFKVTDPVISVNMMSVILSSLSVAILFIALTKIFSIKTSFLSSLYFSFVPLFLTLSTFGNSHMTSVFFFSIALFFLFKFLNEEKYVHLILSGIAFGLMGASRLQAITVIFIPVIFILIFKNRSKLNRSEHHKNTLSTIVLFLFFLSITTAVFYLPLLNHKLSPSVKKMFSASFKNNFIEPVQFLLFDNLNKQFIHLISVQTFIGAVASIAGLFLLSRKRFILFSFFSLLFIVPFVSFGVLPYWRPRMFLIPCIPIVIAQAYFLSNFAYFKRSITALICLSILLPVISIYPTLKLRNEYPLIADYFRWVKEKTEANAYICEADSSLFIKYYSERKPFNPPGMLWAYDEKAKDKYIRQLNTLLGNGEPVYITYIAFIGQPSKIGFEDFLFKNYRLKYIGRHLTEDWHSGCLMKKVVWNPLYKIELKK